MKKCSAFGSICKVRKEYGFSDKNKPKVSVAEFRRSEKSCSQLYWQLSKFPHDQRHWKIIRIDNLGNKGQNLAYGGDELMKGKFIHEWQHVKLLAGGLSLHEEVVLHEIAGGKWRTRQVGSLTRRNKHPPFYHDVCLYPRTVKYD